MVSSEINLRKWAYGSAYNTSTSAPPTVQMRSAATKLSIGLLRSNGAKPRAQSRRPRTTLREYLGGLGIGLGSHSRQFDRARSQTGHHSPAC